jgi:hypothetical protein
MDIKTLNEMEIGETEYSDWDETIINRVFGGFTICKDGVEVFCHTASRAMELIRENGGL